MGQSNITREWSGSRCSSSDILDAHDMTTSSEPMEGDIAENVDEANEGNDIRDPGIRSIGDSTLDRREDGTTRDTHHQDTGASASVAAEILGSEGKESWVHWGLEEEDGDQDTDGTITLGRADNSVQGDGDSGIYHEKEVGLEHSGQASSNKASDSEGDQSV